MRNILLSQYLRYFYHQIKQPRCFLTKQITKNTQSLVKINDKHLPNIKFSKIRKNNHSQKISLNFSTVKDMKIRFDPTKKTQIISLNEQQLQQLAQIHTYMTSINFLQKNDLEKSLQYLNYALNDAKNNFPQSINLHMCILNRKSILLKLLSRNQEFISTLEQIFFLAESLKGLKNIQTHKHLKNYLLSLLFFDRQKMSLVVDFVKGLQEIVNSPRLQQKLPDFMFFDSLSDILIKKQYQQGLKKLQALSQQTFKQKYFKTNNLGWMKYINWKYNSKSPSQLTKKVKADSEQLVKQFLRTLFDMQYCAPVSPNSQQSTLNSNNEYLNELLKGYLVGKVKQLRFVPDKVKLKNHQSHIVTMNLANILFQSERYQQCVYFMKLSLSTALDLGQVERVGTCLLLLAKLNFKSGQNYQQILLSILQNLNNYPTQIIKQTLSIYSQFLFAESRYIEAQHYANQMMSLEGNMDLEGLILPDFDFTF